VGLSKPSNLGHKLEVNFICSLQCYSWTCSYEVAGSQINHWQLQPAWPIF